MSIDPNEAPPGYVAVPPNGRGLYRCQGCDFIESPTCRYRACNRSERADGCDVCFTRKSESIITVLDRDNKAHDIIGVVGDTPQTHYILDPDDRAPMRLVNKAMIAMLNAVFADRLRTMDDIPEELRPLFKEVKA